MNRCLEGSVYFIENEGTLFREVKLVMDNIIKDFHIDKVEVLCGEKWFYDLFPDELFWEIREDFVNEGVFISESSWSKIGELILVLTGLRFSTFFLLFKRQFKDDLINL